MPEPDPLEALLAAPPARALAAERSLREAAGASPRSPGGEPRGAASRRPDPRPGDRSMAQASPVRPTVGSRPAPPAREPRQRPDPRAMRLAFAVTGIAAASAMATAIVTPPASGPTGGSSVVTAAEAPQPTPSHITRYVRLAPGQTAPPQAAVEQLPAPAPRVVVVTTRQSGVP